MNYYHGVSPSEFLCPFLSRLQCRQGTPRMAEAAEGPEPGICPCLGSGVPVPYAELSPH